MLVLRKVENALHVGWFGASRQDVSIELFWRTSFIRKGLADNLSEDRGNLIVSGSLMAKPIDLTIVIFRIQQGSGRNRGHILNVNPAPSGLTDIMPDGAVPDIFSPP